MNEIPGLGAPLSRRERLWSAIRCLPVAVLAVIRAVYYLLGIRVSPEAVLRPLECTPPNLHSRASYITNASDQSSLMCRGRWDGTGTVVWGASTGAGRPWTWRPSQGWTATTAPGAGRQAPRRCPSRPSPTPWVRARAAAPCRTPTGGPSWRTSGASPTCSRRGASRPARSQPAWRTRSTPPRWVRRKNCVGAAGHGGPHHGHQLQTLREGGGCSESQWPSYETSCLPKRTTKGPPIPTRGPTFWPTLDVSCGSLHVCGAA